MLKVVTLSGIEARKQDCILYNNEWYLKGKRTIPESGEIYKIGNKTWALPENCYYNKKRKLYCKLTNSIKFGYESPNSNQDYFTKTPYTVFTEDGFYIKDYRDFPYYYFRGGSDKFFIEPTNHVHNYDKYNTRLYGADDNAQFEEAWVNYTDESVDLPRIKELKNYTFGVEFETSGGGLHPTMLRDTYLIPVRDGSIAGHEFISVPMDGELTTLKNQCYYLSRQCNVNRKCSTHIHIGNLPRTKEFAVAFYLLIYRFQNEINAMFPPFKKLLSALAEKGDGDPKDYCKLLPELNLSYGRNFLTPDGAINPEVLDEAYNDIWTFWNDGVAPNRNSNPDTRIHSKAGNNKWRYLNRYSMINMNNYFFTKSRTIEFRYHEGTLNYGKISNWILINIAFIEFAKNNAKEILSSNSKITFKDILNELSNPELETHLLDYICSRKTEMMRHYSIQNPYYGIFELDKEVDCTWAKLK